MKECNLPEKIDLNDVNNESIEKSYQIYLKELGKPSSFILGYQS